LKKPREMTGKGSEERGEYLNKEIKMSTINDTIDNTVRASM